MAQRAPAQTLLEGFDAPCPTDRLFFALYPDTDTAERIAQLATRLRGELGLTGKPLVADRFHVTLHYLGDYMGMPQDVVDAASEAAGSAARAPFDLIFDNAASFCNAPRNRPFVLRSGRDAGVAAFQQALGAAMRRAGLVRGVERQFTPHVTLLYDDRCIDHQATPPITWTARECVLVHSLIGRSIHVPLARWPLRV